MRVHMYKYAGQCTDFHSQTEQQPNKDSLPSTGVRLHSEWQQSDGSGYQ